MEPTLITGVFAGYELSSGCRWSGIYMVWSLEEFVGIDLSSKKVVCWRGSRGDRIRLRRPNCLNNVFVFISILSMITLIRRWQVSGRLVRRHCWKCPVWKKQPYELYLTVIVGFRWVCFGRGSIQFLVTRCTLLCWWAMAWTCQF